MYFSVEHGSRDIVDRLDSRGCTALHFAADTGGSLDAVKLLCDHDADINIRNSDGLTPFQMARKANRRIISEFLAKKMAAQSTYATYVCLTTMFVSCITGMLSNWMTCTCFLSKIEIEYMYVRAYVCVKFVDHLHMVRVNKKVDVT